MQSAKKSESKSHPCDATLVDAMEYEFPPVITLNVGGTLHTTLLSTLRKCPNSMLASMFSGRYAPTRDTHGHYFVDTNSRHFEHILEFLRHEQLLPGMLLRDCPELALDLYREAGYFSLRKLQDALAVASPAVALHVVRVRCQQHFPNYEAYRARLLQLAMSHATAKKMAACAVGEAGRTPRIPDDSGGEATCGEVVCFVSRINDATPPHFECITETAHLEIGPCNADVDANAFIHTLHADLVRIGHKLRPVERSHCKKSVIAASDNASAANSKCTHVVFKLKFCF